MQIDAALDGPFEKLGELIKASGDEDSSGYRRLLASRLAKKEFNHVALSLKISIPEAIALRESFVAAFGEPA